MTMPRLFLGLSALILLLPLLLLACGGSDEPTDAPASDRATAEPTDLPDSEGATGETEGIASSEHTTTPPTTEGAAPSPTRRATTAPTTESAEPSPTLLATAAPTTERVLPMSTPRPTDEPPMEQNSAETDREALLAFYDGTSKLRWQKEHSTSWQGDGPIDSWEGVTIDDNGRVTELSLSGRSWQGKISPELSKLDKLEVLRLKNAYLGGEIPPELGNLVNLTELDLSENAHLGGEIPPELGNLVNLTELDLSDNRLTGGIPPELGNLTNLTRLSLSRNDLSGDIPPELANLARLEILGFEDNKLSGCIPRTLLDQLYAYDVRSQDLSRQDSGRISVCPFAQEESLGEWILDPENPLLLAAMTGSPADVAKLLPDYQIQNMVTTMINRADSKRTYTAGERNIYERVSPLHLAAGFNKDPGMITLLLDAGAPIEGDRRSLALFYTPLHFAALYNEEPAVTAALLEGGADANASTTQKGVSHALKLVVIQLAAQYNSNPKVIQLLLDWGAGSGLGALYFAAGYNPHLDVLRALLDRFAVGENRQGVLNGIMQTAAKLNPNLEAIKLLLDLGADPADPTHGPIAIRAAISDNPNPEILAALIAGGADTTLLDNQHTLLFSAVRRENTAFAELLLDAGVDPNLGNREGITPIYWAPTGEMVELLVAKGADPNIKPKGRETPLAHAALYASSYAEDGRTKVAALLEAGADPNTIRYDKTPLILWATEYNQASTAQMLLKYGADTTTKDEYGTTALHIAARKSYAAIAEALLEAGADRKAVDDFDRVPCQIARGSGSFTGTPLLVQLCRP